MQNDFIIVLAWPEGMVMAAGAWYDKLLSTEGKYRVGHSALVLVNSTTGLLCYFDFGRYHTPFGFGRARDLETDPDITLNTIANIKDNEILNIQDIVLELSGTKATHGHGKIFASVLKNIDYKKGYDYAKSVQDRGCIAYGPLVIQGTNCSRFVARVMREAKPGLFTALRLRYPFCLSPSPKRNVSIANPNYYVAEKGSCKQVNKSFITSYFSSIERI